MKISRGALTEVNGKWTCTITLSAIKDLGTFLGMLPHADIETKLFEDAPDPAPPPPPRAAPVVDIPIAAPLPEAPAEDHSAALADPKTQVVAPQGFDRAKLGLGQGVAKEIAVFYHMIRDPLFQEFVLEQTKEPQSNVADAMVYAAAWVATQAGSDDLFAIKPEGYPKLSEIQSGYVAWRNKRGGKL